jgi:hypothetical protein
VNRRGIAAVLAADSQLDIGSGLTPSAHGDVHQLSDAGLIDRGERVLLHDLELGVGR